jgi:hypothetical protein
VCVGGVGSNRWWARGRGECRIGAGQTRGGGTDREADEVDAFFRFVPSIRSSEMSRSFHNPLQKEGSKK